MTSLKELNRERLDRLKSEGISHGLQILIDEIQQTQKFNSTQSQVRRTGEEYRKKFVTVYFNWQTDNRLMAHIIINDGDNSRLDRLVIPEAGHRLYANYHDGYQANGGGYSKPFAILERMIAEVKKHITVNDWQSLVKYEVIA